VDEIHAHDIILLNAFRIPRTVESTPNCPEEIPELLATGPGTKTLRGKIIIDLRVTGLQIKTAT
jgi:hypothetical protein